MKYDAADDDDTHYILHFSTWKRYTYPLISHFDPAYGGPPSSRLPGSAPFENSWTDPVHCKILGTPMVKAVPLLTALPLFDIP